MSRLDAHTIGDTIYVVAEWAVNGDSKGMSNRLFAYDPVGDHWTEKKPRPIYRDGFVSAAVNGKLYVIGGSGRPDNGPPSNDFMETRELKAAVEIYDPDSDSWSFGRPSPSPSHLSTICELNGSIYVLGGWVGATWEPSITAYDVAADQWSVKSPLPTQIARRGCVAANGDAYLIGGQDLSSSSGGLSDRVDAYDPLVETWATATRLPTARYSAGTEVVGSEVFVLGGRMSNSKITDVTEVLDLAKLGDDAIP
jgi:N-acetylneuraminic acid mutarotase